MARAAPLHTAIEGSADPARQAAHGTARATSSPRHGPGHRGWHISAARRDSPVRRVIQQFNTVFVVKTCGYPLLILLRLSVSATFKCESRVNAAIWLNQHKLDRCQDGLNS